MNDLMYSLSYALDAVESELLGATTYHTKRVAYIAVRMGKRLNLDQPCLLKLALACVLHDNALAEYMNSEEVRPDGKELIPGSLAGHCLEGEKNISVLPFYKGIEKTILYHHECADGHGPFGKTASEVSLFARILHLADNIDVVFSMDTVDDDKYDRICSYIGSNTGTLFDDEITALFHQTFPYEELTKLTGESIEQRLRDFLPGIRKEYSNEDLINIASMFAKIIDYKSSFTHDHSMGVAGKARKLGTYYGYDDNELAKL